MVFDYAESWLNKPGATPLSQSLPLRKKRFNRNECRGYFAGILPEETKREIIARNLGISARNDYAMLERIGGECAGAVIAALTENGADNPWAVADACNKCGLTHEQIVTLSGQGKSSNTLHEPLMLTSFS